MTAFLRRLPVPAGCVALGLIGLGTLLGSISPLFLHVFGILSILLQIAVLLKLFLPGTLKAICSDTVTFSTLSGTSMALMLTAAQLKKAVSFPGAVWIWYLGLCLHLLILLLFSCRLLQERPGFSGARGSWLLVYVGIAAAAISAPAVRHGKARPFSAASRRDRGGDSPAADLPRRSSARQCSARPEAALLHHSSTRQHLARRISECLFFPVPDTDFRASAHCPAALPSCADPLYPESAQSFQPGMGRFQLSVCHQRFFPEAGLGSFTPSVCSCTPASCGIHDCTDIMYFRSVPVLALPV